MSFDALTVGVLVRPGDAPTLPEAEDAALQDAHLATSPRSPTAAR